MQTTKACFVCLVVSAVLVAGEMSYAVQGPLQAGTAKITITPEETRYPVHDTCYARSLVLEVSGQRIAFVSVDLGIYTSESLARQCKEKFGLSQFFLSSSHTHSGPDTATASSSRSRSSRSWPRQSRPCSLLGSSRDIEASRSWVSIA